MRPFLAGTARAVSGRAHGHTIATDAVPETTDEQEPPDAHLRTTGATSPWLALRAVRAPSSDLSGKSIVTRLAAESADEGDDDR